VHLHHHFLRFHIHLHLLHHPCHAHNKLGLGAGLKKTRLAHSSSKEKLKGFLPHSFSSTLGFYAQARSTPLMLFCFASILVGVVDE